MKIESLTLQAFGPFNERQHIDFQALGDGALFLINGPTGAGKTTLLDALCFALYGQTTGNTRSATEMRCQHAPASRLTEVEFTFRLRDKRYKIKRIPQQHRPKARGEGFTIEKPKATLWDCSTEPAKVMVASSAIACTETINQLTGLNADQFRQVIVLPQDNFRQFLLADSTQREAIFGQLFDTAIFKAIELKLKSRGSDIVKQVEHIRERIQGVLMSADLDTAESLSTTLAKIKEQLEDSLAWKHVAATMVEQSKDSLQKAENLEREFKQLNVLKQEQETHQKRVQWAQEEQLQLDKAQHADKLDPYFQQVETLKNKLNEIDAAKKAAHNHCREVEAQRADLNTKALQLERIKDKLADHPFEIKRLKSLGNDVDRISELETAIRLRQKQEHSDQKKLQQLKTQAKSNQQQSQALVDQIERTQAQGPLLGRYQVCLDVLCQVRDLFRDSERKTHFIEQKKQLINDKVLIEQAQRNELNTFSQQVQHLELLWHEQQAARLARVLKKDVACPVCGSTEHPAPKKLSLEQRPIDEEELNKAKEALLDLNQRVDSISQSIQVEKTILAESLQQRSDVENKLKSEIKRLSTLAEKTISTGAEVTAAIAEYRHRIQNIEQQLSDIDKLKMESQQILAQVNILESDITDTTNRLSQLALEQSKDQQSLLHLKEKLPSSINSRAHLDQHIHKLESAWQDFLSQQESLSAAFAECDKNSIQWQTIEKECEQQRESLLKEKRRAEKQWLEQLEHHQFNDLHAFHAARRTNAEQAEMKKAIATVNQKQTELSAALTQQQARLKNQSPPKVSLLKTHWQEQQARYQQLDSLWQDNHHQHQVLLKLDVQVAKLDRQQQKLQQEYQIWGSLAQTTSGQNPHKINLQRYVLSVLLDEVLSKASLRLQTMSRGRYQLLRQQDRAKGNKASGLDLVVADLYTGQSRPASTLSGGESFLAALALALGLSDSVQNHAGGIKLDTLFIDEGFGSLDQEALSLAIDTLLDLQDLGRTIGIISHVEALKELLSCRIDIDCKNGESKARLVGALATTPSGDADKSTI